MAHTNPVREIRDAHLLHVGDERVEIAFDPDGACWFVRAASRPGLVGESADTPGELEAALPALIAAARLP